MANERRLVSFCGECANYNWKKHKCMACSCKESNPTNPFYDDCPLPKGVEVIYCKDCVYFKTEEWHNVCLHAEKGIVCPEAEDFCSYGKRKSGTQPQREDV